MRIAELMEMSLTAALKGRTVRYVGTAQGKEWTGLGKVLEVSVDERGAAHLKVTLADHGFSPWAPALQWEVV